MFLINRDKHMAMANAGCKCEGPASNLSVSPKDFFHFSLYFSRSY